MNIKLVKKNVILGVLFFLPVTFLLFLLPAKHNYNPLEIINNDVMDMSVDEDMRLKDHLTVLAFFGKKPMDKAIAASNLKELIYDRFKGFKKFQIVVISALGTNDSIAELKKEIYRYEQLRYWHFTYHSDEDIKNIYNSLKTDEPLDENLSTDNVFIIDIDSNQRGRLDDRDEKEKANNSVIYGLNAYDCIEVSEIKNKMSDDLRVLFTEYREKRKGNFDSSQRRANDLKGTDEQEN
jgi:hypothetical protein